MVPELDVGLPEVAIVVGLALWFVLSVWFYRTIRAALIGHSKLTQLLVWFGIGFLAGAFFIPAIPVIILDNIRSRLSKRGGA